MSDPDWAVTEEEKRLQQTHNRTADWRLWGPYVSERAWGSVREDYSADGSAWEYLPHDHARSRVYRWNEDGLAGICDSQQRLCFALALWNGRDAILKERLFGLTGSEGNHGEDVKESYSYLDNTPSHAYMKYLYKYPQLPFPYSRLVEENRCRGTGDPEFELLDTGVFDDDRYFDVTVEYAKASTEDILIQISAYNCGGERAALHLLPTLWFRNTWAWGYDESRPKITALPREPNGQANAPQETGVLAEHHSLGSYSLLCQPDGGGAELLFTENETNFARLYPPHGVNPAPYVKDGFHAYVVDGDATAVNPAQEGSKFAAHYSAEIAPGETWTVRLRLCRNAPATGTFGASFDEILERRIKEADAFYATVAPEGASQDMLAVQRQAFAGMLWNKQFYHYNVRKWLAGDPSQPEPPPERGKGRNHNWQNVDSVDVISMPDKWEYPWFAAWDLAFHCVALAVIDSEFAKNQLILLLREWYMHPNGQIPAYEWALGDVNPPVHAWAALRVYQIERRRTGVGDTRFLERVFHKLLLNFTWWVNRKDSEERNVFQGGFLGLDNIGVFDRSAPLPPGCRLDQSDGTSWMAMYCLNLLAIALELARRNNAYEDVATKFLEHFFNIAHAMNGRSEVSGDSGDDLWDEKDSFYYDLLYLPDGSRHYLRVRSMVGLIPLFAVETLDSELLDILPNFTYHLNWFLKNRPDLCESVASITRTGVGDRRMFSVVNAERLRCILQRLLSEEEFLSPYGIRSVSRYHLAHPYQIEMDGVIHQVGYEPAESRTRLFGGNSNWRGPVWFPLNYLIIESLQKYYYYYGSDFKVEHPVGSGKMLTLWEVSTELSQRLIRLFLQDERGRRPVFGNMGRFQTAPRWRDLIMFHEYFHGDNGAGLGASHQTGWSGLVAKLILQSGGGHG